MLDSKVTRPAPPIDTLNAPALLIAALKTAISKAGGKDQPMKPFILRLLLPFHWLFVRLPKPFTLPFLAAAFLYFALLFPAFDSTLGHLIVLSLGYSITALSRSGIPKIVSGILLIL